MTITVKLFASYREAVGARELSLEMPEGVTVGQLVARLAEQHPRLGPLLASATFAVNRQYVRADTHLSAGDEVLILPPVAGGRPEWPKAEPGRFEIVETPISLEAVAAKVAYPGAGAIVLFTGVVREVSNSGRPVTHLEYEAYREMAEEQMAAIADEIRDRWGLAHIAVTHRVGRLAVGEVAVVIAVASPHRREGFEACQYAIDRLKQLVPIWKKEIGPDGAIWVE